MFVAYREDGIQVKFAHAVDYRIGISRGLFRNPPGISEPKKEAPKPEGEKVIGIEPIMDKTSSSISTGPIPEKKSFFDETIDDRTGNQGSFKKKGRNKIVRE